MPGLQGALPRQLKKIRSPYEGRTAAAFASGRKKGGMVFRESAEPALAKSSSEGSRLIERKKKYYVGGKKSGKTRKPEPQKRGGERPSAFRYSLSLPRNAGFHWGSLEKKRDLRERRKRSLRALDNRDEKNTWLI